jgi:hypothetical protein
MNESKLNKRRENMMITSLKNTVPAVVSQARAITITPISLKKDNGSQDNYLLEQSYMERGYSPMWTDAPENLSKPGDLFAYVIGATTKKSSPCVARIHKIVAVLPNNCKRADWGTTCNEHKITESSRNVLVLSQQLAELDWESFSEIIHVAPYSKKSIGDSTDPQRSPIQRTVSIKIK